MQRKLTLSAQQTSMQTAANGGSPPFVSIDMNGPEPTFEQLAAKGCFEPTPDNRQPAAESTNSLPVFVQPINVRRHIKLDVRAD